MTHDGEPTATGLETETGSGSLGPGPLAATRVPGLSVLWHPDVARVGERAPIARLAAGAEVALSRLEPLFAAPGSERGPHPLDDRRLSRSPIRLRRDGAAIRVDAADTATTLEVDGVAGGRTVPLAALDAGVVLVLGGRVALLLHRFDPVMPTRLPHHGLVGESPAMVALRQAIGRVADLAVPVLLRGESGTGKELVARALHQAGPRRNGPFVAVSMAAVPPTLAAAELFGAARGAFTGADRRREGFFRRADGGTLFLDEIGETPLELQAMLLRALESGEVQPVGDERPQRVDVRLVSATDADLERAVAADRFRSPLLHRLQGFTLRLPPLRERRDDVARLFATFLRGDLEAIGEGRRLAPEAGPWVPAELVARLVALPWPGNVRQLRNAVRQLTVSHREAERIPTGLRLDEIVGPASAGAPNAAAKPTVTAPVGERRPAEIREEELVAALRAHRWRLQATATALGIARSSLYELIEKTPAVRKASELSAAEIVEALERCGGSPSRAADRLEVSEAALQRRMRRVGLAGDAV